MHNVLHPLLQATLEIFRQDHAGKRVGAAIELVIDQVGKEGRWHHRPAQPQPGGHNFGKRAEPHHIAGRVHGQHRWWRLPLKAQVAVDIVLNDQHAILHRQTQHLTLARHAEVDPQWVMKIG